MAESAAYLDPDSPDSVRLSVDEAREIGETAVRRIGFSDDEARIIVDQLIDNALCGYKFASLPRILAIASNPLARQPRTPLRIIHETPVSALIDGGNNVGYVTVYRAAEIAIAKARTHGIASVGVNNSYFSGRNAYYVERIVREGYVVLHVASAPARVLPLGGARPILGTNPISFGFPSEEGPVVFDMGTASLMVGELQLHAHLGLPLPDGLAFDAAGRPTRDAAEALKGGGVLPFGGHKGYGLAFAIQAMGLLAGATAPRGNPVDYGFLFWVVNPEIMLPGHDFKTEMSRLVRAIKATPRQPGVEEIRIPSERASRERERRLVEGIVLDRTVVEALRAI